MTTRPTHWLAAVRAWWKFRSYRPIKVTPRLVISWLGQYPSEARSDLLRLLEDVQFLDERFVTRALIEQNDRILTDLRSDGVSLKNVIYVQHDDAASSSPVMLNLLRDGARLERSGAKFIDGRDQLRLSEVTAELNIGGIIYVDDFAGSGTQFIGNRAWTSQFIAGSFSEFFLGVVICEEAFLPIQSAGVVPRAAIIHRPNERPLYSDCSSLDGESRVRLLELGKTLDKKYPLGFKNFGTNIVFYRNAPNSTPLLLRGNVTQHPKFGVLPRTTDLPAYEDL